MKCWLRECAVLVVLLLLLQCCGSSALLDVEREASAVASSARPLPLILSPLHGSTVAHNGSVHIRIVVPALARAVCARAYALSIFLDDTAIASQPLPPHGPEPFHAAFALDVASMHLHPGVHELLVQFADGEGASVGSAAAVEILVQDPGHVVSHSPWLSRSDNHETFACSARSASSWMCRDDGDCNRAGSCMRGICHCQPGWFGATCSVNPEESSEYAPAIDPLRDAAVQCAETSRHARVATRLREMIGGWREKPADCACFQDEKDSSGGGCPVIGSVPLYGIGAQIRHATRLLHTAVSEQRPLVLVAERGVDGRMVAFAPCMPMPRWVAEAAPAHAHDDPGYAFNGWKSDTATPDNATAHGFPQQVVCVLLPTHACSPLLRVRAARRVRHLLLDPHTWRYLAPEFSPPPPELAASGMLAFRSELTASLLTPLPWFEALLTLQAAALGLVAPSLGVHLRRGDACVHHEWDPAFRPPCAQAATYVDAAVLMVQRYNPASVCVSSDDSAAAAEFEVALRAAGFEIPIAIAGVGDMYHGRSLLEDRVGWDHAEPADVSWTTLRDIFMLSRSDFFVVNFASQLSRVAFELAVSRRSGLLPPYISVDGYPWCDAPCKFGRNRQRLISEAMLSQVAQAPSRC
jgi:hypothetical protein